MSSIIPFDAQNKHKTEENQSRNERQMKGMT
jgi:hypothetical protein